MHYVAFAVESHAAQEEVRKALIDTGYQVAPVIDRDYFWAIYFRAPGGNLFEVATNARFQSRRGHGSSRPGTEAAAPVCIAARADRRGPAADRRLVSRLAAHATQCFQETIISRDAYHHFAWTPEAGAPLIFIFHGTGEQPFTELVQQMLAVAGIVSPRGDVSEHGANRFFRSMGEGFNDIADLALRTQKMVDFIRAQ